MAAVDLRQSLGYSSSFYLVGSGGKTQYVQQLNNYVQALDKAGQLSAWAKPEAVAEDRRTNGDYCATAVGASY